MIPSNKKRFLLSSIGIFGALVLATFVFIVAAAQSTLPGKALTTDPANDMRPTWSPDGSQIAFFSLRSGNYDIWVMDADGGNQRQLTTDPADERRPAWSPDGTMIAFDSDLSGTRDIWILNVESGEVRQFTSGDSIDTFASWNPDGSQIAYYAYQDGSMDIWVASTEAFLDGEEASPPVQLTTELSSERQNGCTFGCHTPAWSPDGQFIAFPRNNHSEVWVMGADGNNPYQVIGGGEHEHFPTWTPEGKLLFLSEHMNTREELVNDVWMVDADGGNPTLLFTNIPHGGPFYWNLNEPGVIAFHSPRAGNFDIYFTTLGQEEIAAVEELAPTDVPEAAPTPEEVIPTEAPPPAPVQPEQETAPAAEPGLGLNQVLGWGGLVVAIVGLFSAIIYLVRRSG